MNDLVYNLPNSKEEWFVTGSFVNINEHTILFEIPAVFEGGTCNTTATLDKINKFIDLHNKIVSEGNQWPSKET